MSAAAAVELSDPGPPYVLEICGDEPPTPLQEGVRECVLSLPTPDSPCGFHLSRTHWDPFPWVGRVEPEGAASRAGLRSGDCLLRVNDHSLLGNPVATAARLVKGPAQAIRLFVWSPGLSDKCRPDALCCGPMPTALQKLSGALSKILNVLECPVCMDTIQPPAHQCVNGHLICLQCRARSEKCPVCRIKFGRGRSLLADQVFTSITEAFSLAPDPGSESHEKSSNKRLRERLFGHLLAQRTPSSPDLSSSPHPHPPSPRTSPKHRLLSRLLGKAHSVDNLSTIGGGGGGPPRALQDGVKSLSSSEIFRPSSPIEIRRPFFPLGQSLGRPASYHGSAESINSEVDVGPVVRYHCPLSCASLLLSLEEVLRHLRSAHGTSHLVHVYESKFEIPGGLLPLRAPLLFMVENHVFFVHRPAAQWRASVLAPQEVAQGFELRVTDDCNNQSHVPVISLAKGLRPAPHLTADMDHENEKKSWKLHIVAI